MCTFARSFTTDYGYLADNQCVARVIRKEKVNGKKESLQEKADFLFSKRVQVVAQQTEVFEVSSHYKFLFQKIVCQ